MLPFKPSWVKPPETKSKKQQVVLFRVSLACPHPPLSGPRKQKRSPRSREYLQAALMRLLQVPFTRTSSLPSNIGNAWSTLGLGINNSQFLAVKWLDFPLNHNEQKCKMFPNNNHEWGPLLGPALPGVLPQPLEASTRIRKKLTQEKTWRSNKQGCAVLLQGPTICPT